MLIILTSHLRTHINGWCNIGFKVLDGVEVEAKSFKKRISPLLEEGRFLWRLVSPNWSTSLSPEGRGREEKKSWYELTSQKLPKGSTGKLVWALPGALRDDADSAGWCHCEEICVHSVAPAKNGVGGEDELELSVLCAWVNQIQWNTACVKVEKTGQQALWC